MAWVIKQTKSELREILRAPIYDGIKTIESMKPKIEVPYIPMPDINLDYDDNMAKMAFTARLEAANYANDQAVQAVGNALRIGLNTMMASMWAWEGGARDIIDTGALMASQDVMVTSNKISISYASPYANLIHYGGYVRPYGNMNIEKQYIPGRPWISATLGQTAGPAPPVDYREIYRTTFMQNF